MTDRDSVQDLGAQLRDGQENALEMILRVHGPPVLALLRQRFAGRLHGPDFEEILATALFRIWQHRSQFDQSRASLRVWFYRIAENLARDVFKLGWHKAKSLEMSLQPSVVDAVTRQRTVQDGELPETNGSLRISPEQLRELLTRLPENQRRIILADAQSPEGIVPSQNLSRELGIPPATVRVYRRRALERLRIEIERRELADEPSPAETLP